LRGPSRVSKENSTNSQNPLIRSDKVIIYIDDILIPTETVEQNLLRVRTYVRRSVKNIAKNMGELNLMKCQFLKKEIEFLGFIISIEGITLSSRHVEAVKNFKRPENVQEVQRFLGLCGYFRKFIKDYALKARPLQNLLKKTVKFIFDDACVQAFQLLKKELTSESVLCVYDPAAETELHTDACSLGLAAILLQKQKGNLWGPVAYYSQTTNQAETRYHCFELEMLDIKGGGKISLVSLWIKYYYSN